MPYIRKETDGLGVVEVAADKLWDAQTHRSLKLTVRCTLEK